MNINRRKFLLQSGSLFLGSLALPSVPIRFLAQQSHAFGNPRDDHFFVLMRVTGGMDCTLGLDPQVLPRGADAQDLFLEYRPSDIVQASGVKMAPATTPLKPYADRCAFINGIQMRAEAGHEFQQRYMATGALTGASPSLAIELAGARKKTTLGVIIEDRNSYVGTQQIPLTAAESIIHFQSAPEDHRLVSKVSQQASSAPSELQLALQSLAGFQSQEKALLNELQKLQAVPSAPTSPEVIAAAFKTGMSGSAQVEIGAKMDTHSDHENRHLTRQKETWQRVADFFRLFERTPYKGGTLFDHTTFAVVTEFSRTPYLNSRKGKDHNPFTNSALLAGKGVIGGQMIGASHLVPRSQRKKPAIHIATPFDYSTGRPVRSENADFIYPENFARTIQKIFGDPKGFDYIDSKVKPITGAFRV